MNANISFPAVVAAHFALYGGLAASSSVMAHGDAAVASVILATGLIYASVTDIRRFVIPDGASLGLILAGFLATVWFRPENLGLHALATALWYLGLAAISEGYWRWRGREGLGLGDAKLMAAAGAWLGPEGSVGVLLFAASAGVVSIVAFLAIRGFHVPDPAGAGIAFGPFISLAFWIVWLYGLVG